MTPTFSLDQLKLIRAAANSARTTPGGSQSNWQAIFDTSSLLIAEEVCRPGVLAPTSGTGVCSGEQLHN